MKANQIHRYEMLVRVRDFAVAHADLFPPKTIAGRAFAEVDAAVNELSRHAVSTMASGGAVRDGVGSRAAARAALIERVRAISRTARIAAAANPDLEGKLTWSGKGNDRALLAAGRLFFTGAAPCEAALVAHGLPKTFRADLNAAIERFDEALRTRNARRDTHIAAEASLSEALQAGFAAVQKLDVLVANVLHNDPVTMAVWERDRRVESPRRGKTTAADVTTEAAASSTPATPKDGDVKAVA